MTRRFPGRVVARQFDLAVRRARAMTGATTGAVTTKYRAQKAVGSIGEVYDSRLEREVAYWLEARLYRGEIVRWSWGPTFQLQGPDPAHPDLPRITLKVDFVVWPDATHWYGLDAKGVPTRDFRTKAKLWAAVHPVHPLRVIGKDMQERPAC